jgi:peptidoglycan hydrolase CwlO-like protein
METIKVNLTGVDPRVVHIHITNRVDNTPVLARLTSMENTMSELSDAVAAQTAAIADLTDKISVDFAELQRQLAAKDALLQEALATDVADAATIADLTARNEALNAETAATVASITANTSALNALDPLPDFPAAPPAG